MNEVKYFFTQSHLELKGNNEKYMVITVCKI